ncbi:MAG: terpene cyclase/mutase family protein [Candidatus Zixiibacteriota bacterium]|nr:MAG: terpene cyclase/mutase family protein [candidate division Zixibacteria bacterium]
MPVEWLLTGEPWVKYRVLTDLLGSTKDNPDVIAARKSIHLHPLIEQLFKRRNKDGYWGSPEDIRTWWPKKNTTFWLLGVLADLGMDSNLPEIAKACDYVFSTQLPGGGFGWGSDHPTPAECFTAILTESLAKLGYTHDSRLKRAYDWLIQRQRRDGGFWCKTRGLPGGPRELEPSCAFASLCVLGALCCNPVLKDNIVSSRCAKFLLECWKNRGKMKYAGHDSQIGTGWEKLKYPFTDYRILKYLDVLSQIDPVKNESTVDAMMELLFAKQDAEGRFCAESVHKCWQTFDFGRKKIPSRWITLLVYRIAGRMRQARQD